MSGLGRSLSFCAVRVVRWGPILEAGIEEGTWRAEPEELRRRSLLLRAERAVVEEGPAALVVGNDGWRRGGLAVETCGLKETFRMGLLAEMGRGVVVVVVVVVIVGGRRGEASDAPFVVADMLNHNCDD